MKIQTIFPLIILSSFAGSYATADTTVFVDFGGSATTPAPWNNITHGSTGQASFANQEIEDLTDSGGFDTGISLLASTPNTIGYNTDNSSLSYTTDYPLTANQDFLYMDSGDVLTVTLSNLNQSLTYDLTLFGSRNATGSRITQYDLTAGTISGSTQRTLEAVDNVGNTVTFAAVTPDISNEISFTVQRQSGSAYGYINVLEISFVPEPSSYALLAGISGLAWVMLRRRRV